MRLLLLPISTKRTLLYCIRARGRPEEKEKIADKITRRAAKLWSDWEKKEGGWQRKVVDYGNYAFRRIPYQEWGLKSVPSLSARKKEAKLIGKDEVDLVFPPSIIPAQKAEEVLLTLGTEREALHKRKFTWCLIGMPITLPFALVPM
jgi:K+-H+ exchange-related protein